MRFSLAIIASIYALSTLGFGLIEDPAAQCRVLAGVRAPDTQLDNVALIADRPDLPSFCQVEGRIAERVGFILRLPVESWNGKFTVAGCGGFCGGLRPALRLGSGCRYLTRLY